MKRVLIWGLCALLTSIALLGCGSSGHSRSSAVNPVILTAGDIAYCNPGATSQATRTAKLLERDGSALVLALGDNAYRNGQPTEYKDCYSRAWGVAKARTRPVVGEHDEGRVPGGPPPGTGYLEYFTKQLAPLGVTASDPTKLYYSFNLGAWHVIVLNDACLAHLTPRCNEQAQQQWLQADLAAHDNYCVLAAWHRPRWSSDSVHGDARSIAAFWNILYRYGVDLVLNASAHDYERFASQDPDGALDTSFGIREIVVGTGGNGLYPLGKRKPNSQVFDSTSYGVLQLTLRPMSYQWKFLPVADGGHHGGSFTDSGASNCHPPPPH